MTPSLITCWTQFGYSPGNWERSASIRTSEAFPKKWRQKVLGLLATSDALVAPDILVKSDILVEPDILVTADPLIKPDSPVGVKVEVEVTDCAWLQRRRQQGRRHRPQSSLSLKTCSWTEASLGVHGKGSKTQRRILNGGRKRSSSHRISAPVREEERDDAVAVAVVGNDHNQDDDNQHYVPDLADHGGCPGYRNRFHRQWDPFCLLRQQQEHSPSPRSMYPTTLTMPTLFRRPSGVPIFAPLLKGLVCGEPRSCFPWKWKEMSFTEIKV